MSTLSLVLVTKDRPVQVRVLLESLKRQTRKPDEVIIVDDGALDTAALLSLLEAAGITGHYLEKATPGVVVSRRLGVQQAQGDIILFLDDDVLLDEGYCAAIMTVYESDSEQKVGGVGGVLIRRSSVLKQSFLRFFCLEGLRPGGVLPNGLGTLITNISLPVAVDWLSGCNMSFRKKVFETIDFDTMFGGNGWGDDRDFSYRVGRYWVLMATPDAQLIHLESPGGRADSMTFGQMEIWHTYVFFKKHMPQHRINWLSLWWAMIGIMIKNLLCLKGQQIKGNIKAWRAIVRDRRERNYDRLAQEDI